ncbi:MAG: TlpA family protein disulfide reductase [Clostridia bacterium]|nr:TlpA family protein disulfide reductase [Clostridia bacterium]
MKNTVKWGITAALLAVIIIGASLLYNNLSKEYSPEALLPSSTSAPSAETSNPPDFSAPDFTVSDNTGNEVRLSDFKGKPIVLNFWATWCHYCKQGMPDFDKAYHEYPDVQFLMVNATDGIQETFENAKNYVEEKGYSFDVFYDTSLDAVRAYYVTSFPVTYFIDSDGNLVTRGNGMLDYESIEKGIAMITENN